MEYIKNLNLLEINFYVDKADIKSQLQNPISLGTVPFKSDIFYLKILTFTYNFSNSKTPIFF